MRVGTRRSCAYDAALDVWDGVDLREVTQSLRLQDQFIKGIGSPRPILQLPPRAHSDARQRSASATPKAMPSCRR
jgi:hypothetical protein